MPSESLPAFRKVCSTAPYLHPLQRSAAAASAAESSFPLPAAVFLLNSPSSTAADFNEYLSLWERAQRRQSAPDAGVRSPPCTFVCADGAYAALLRHCDSLPDVDTTVPLCDVLIGDMDSIDAHTWSRAAGADVTMPEMPTTNTEDTTAVTKGASAVQLHKAALFDFCGHRYETVNDIPESVVEKLHRRIHDRRSARPDVLPVACQMTTDFQKGLLLLLRLQRAHSEDVPFYSTERDVDKDAEPWKAAAWELVALTDSLCEFNANRCATELSDASEADRIASLLNECSGHQPIEEGRRMHSVVLPTVAVLGALGGRLDHEIAAFSTITLFARKLDILLLNAQNIVMSCWPDGVTQWVPWDPSVPSEATAAHHRTMCGVLPLGPALEMETTGLLYNVVSGRTPPRYDGYTQTGAYHFGLDGIVSACNEVTQSVVTVDLRPLNPAHKPVRERRHPRTEGGSDSFDDLLVDMYTHNAGGVNPPTIVTCERERCV